MADDLSYDSQFPDPDWGCTHLKIDTSHHISNIVACHVQVSDLLQIASELSSSIMDDAWVMDIDQGARRSYQRTVQDTAERLVEIFSDVIANESLNGEFGEIMVSMGASRSLEIILDHTSLPIAELWKPQEKGNEGFDFHTVCEGKIINFGEAKYLANNSSPYTPASNQANGFFDEDKHFRDRTHLINLVDDEAIENLDQELFGVIVAFSMNAKKPLEAFSNAISKVYNSPIYEKVQRIYLVGVTHGN